MRQILAPLIIAAALSLVPACQASVSVGDSAGSSSAGSPPADKTYTDNGVTFTYPGAFSESDLSPSASTNTPTWQQGFSTGNGSSYLWLALYANATTVAVTSGNIEQAGPEMTKALEMPGATVDSGPTVTTMGELPALNYTVTYAPSGGESVASRVVFAFDGTDEYFLNCQYTPADQAQVLDACRQVVDSFVPAP